MSSMTTKKPTCKVMILDVFKNSGKTSITTSNIISEIEKKYEYKNKAPIKTALKKLVLDQTVLSCEAGPLGSLKINAEKVVDAKKDVKKPVSKDSKKLQAAKKTTATAKRALKKTDGSLVAKKPAKPKPRKNCMSDKLYADLCAIGAKDYLEKSKRQKKQCYIGKSNQGNCFLSALCLKHMTIDPKNKEKELDRVMYTGECHECKGEIKATVRDLLEQSDYGGDVYEDEGGPLSCKTKDCMHSESYGYFVTGLCGGQPGLECGKFHNHCMDCQGLGTCSGDYRNAHCRWCNKHYFAGSMGGGHQGCRKSGGGGGGRRGFGGGGRRGDCSIM